MAASNVQAAISKAAAELQSIERSLASSRSLAAGGVSFASSGLLDATGRSVRHSLDEHTDVDVATSPDGRAVRVSVHQHGEGHGGGLGATELARELGVSVGARGNSAAVLRALQLLQDKIKRLEREKLQLQGNLADLDATFSRFRTAASGEAAEIERAHEVDRAQWKSRLARADSQLAAQAAHLSEARDEAASVEAAKEALQRDLDRAQRATAEATAARQAIQGELDAQREQTASLQASVQQLTDALRAAQAKQGELAAQADATAARLQSMVDLNATLTRTLQTAPQLEPAAPRGATIAPRRRAVKKRGKRSKRASGSGTARAAATSQLTAFSAGPLPWVAGQSAGPSHSVLANAQLSLSDPAAVGFRGTPATAAASTAAASARRTARLNATARAALSEAAEGGEGKAEEGKAAEAGGGAGGDSLNASLSRAATASSIANATLSRVEAALAAAGPLPAGAAVAAPAGSSAHTPVRDVAPSGGEAFTGISAVLPSPVPSRGGGDASFLPGSAAGSVAAPAWASRTHGMGGVDVDPTFTASGRLVPHRTLAPERNMLAVMGALAGEVEELQGRYDRLVAAAAASGDSSANTALADIALLLQDKMSQLELLRQAESGITEARERSPVRNPAAAARRSKAVRAMRSMRQLAADSNRRIGGGVTQSGVDRALLK